MINYQKKCKLNYLMILKTFLNFKINKYRMYYKNLKKIKININMIILTNIIIKLKI